jgi:hypothetical protein
VVGLFIFLIILGTLALLIGIIWFTSVRIEILFKRENENDRSEIKVLALGGLLRFQIELPQVKWEGFDEGAQVRGNLQAGSKSKNMVKRKEIVRINRRTLRKIRTVYHEILERFEHYHRIIRWFLSKVTCEKFVWITKIGTGDAAEAGILTGMAWGVKTTLVGILGSYLRWNEPPQLTIDPEFNRSVLETYFHSIIRFRVGHVILGAKRLLLHMRRGRERTWQSTQFRA